MATRQEICSTIEAFESDIQQAVSDMPDAAWSGGVYESGWNARQLLSHIASTSGVTSFILNMAQAPSLPASDPRGGSFNIDDFNKLQVEMRAGKSTDEVLAEIRSNLQRDIGAIQAADEALINKHFKAPWDAEGRVSDMIVSSFHDHLGMHLADLKSAATP
jgi:hypothetical protein